MRSNDKRLRDRADRRSQWARVVVVRGQDWWLPLVLTGWLAQALVVELVAALLVECSASESARSGIRLRSNSSLWQPKGSTAEMGSLRKISPAPSDRVV